MTLIDKLFDTQVTGLAKSMDLTAQRNKVIASNVANTETPGYRAKDLNFANELERAFSAKDTKGMQISHPKHIATSAGNGLATIIEDQSGVTKPDGNNVDLDLQMGQLSYNSGKYSSAANLLRKKLSFLKMVIREGAR